MQVKAQGSFVGSKNIGGVLERRQNPNKWIHAYMLYGYEEIRGQKNWQKVSNLNWGNIAHLTSGAVSKNMPLHSHNIPAEIYLWGIFGQFLQ